MEMTVEELLAIVGGERVELDEAARARIHEGWSVLREALARGEPVYGVNRQVGSKKDMQLSDDAVRRQQEWIVMSHAGGLGPSLSTEVVRAALMVRLSGIARGGSGASPRVAEVLAAMLNAGVHPVVPAFGSAGAGDVGQMTGMAQVAIGQGRAELGGEVLPGGEALERTGIEPLVLEGKDGLSFVSSNGVSVGHAALVVARAAQAADAADVVAALSLEAVRGNPSIALPAVGEAKPFPGQIEACRSMRAALAGSSLLEPGAPRSIQDALSFRVAPQVHGALREQIAFALRAVETELNAVSDNPLVSLSDRTIVHNGNFHPIVPALACDALRVGLAHVGQLSERRMSHLWDEFMRGMADLQGAPPEIVGVGLRYPAAARFAELKQLAAPATLDVPPLETGGAEDHHTSAPLSVRKAEESLALLEDILAVELLLARDVLILMPARPALGAGTGALLETAEAALAAAADRTPDGIHRVLRERFPGVPLTYRPPG
jgi:histidine ammonia-lyase